MILQTCATDPSLQQGHTLCHIFIIIPWIDLIMSALVRLKQRHHMRPLQMLLETACDMEAGLAAAKCIDRVCANLVLHRFPHCLALSILDFALQGDDSLLIVTQPLPLHLLPPQHCQLLQRLRMQAACHCHLHDSLQSLSPCWN